MHPYRMFLIYRIIQNDSSDALHYTALYVTTHRILLRMINYFGELLKTHV